EELERFERCNIIERVSNKPATGEYISNIFTRPKKDGRIRIILNLKQFNDHMQHIHFKMETLQTAINLCYFGSVDLSEAYYSIPINEQNRKYFRFWYAGQKFQFKVQQDQHKSVSGIYATYGTEHMRGTTQQLLITTQKPFRAATRDTVSRWIKTVLTKAKVGEQYKPHSVRAASTSAAKYKGVTLNTTIKTAGWSNDTMFARFYNKPIGQKQKTV
ncbi:hypothetical protein MAR_036573, partial [Mya arenaria]